MLDSDSCKYGAWSAWHLLHTYARLARSYYNGGMYTSKIRPAIEKYLEDRPNEAAFLRSEFNGLGETRSGVDKALRAMVKDGKLVRVGYGVHYSERIL